MGDPRKCVDCGGCWPDDPSAMFTNDIWKGMGYKKTDLVCHPCSIKKLGRDITPNDLRACMWNVGFSENDPLKDIALVWKHGDEFWEQFTLDIFEKWLDTNEAK